MRDDGMAGGLDAGWSSMVCSMVDGRAEGGVRSYYSTMYS